MSRKGEKKKNKRRSNINVLSAKLVEYTVWILIAVIILCTAIFGSRYVYNLGYRIFDRADRNVESHEYSITITKDEKIDKVASALEDAGIIDSAFVFKIQSILFKLDVKPGTYVVNMRTSSLVLLEQLNEGPGI